MSEKLPKSHERRSPIEIDASEINKEAAAKSKEKAEKSTHEHIKNIENIRTSIDKEARSTREDDGAEHEKNEQEETEQVYIGKDLLEETYRRTLRKTRQHLSSPMRGFSRIIHNPTVEIVSELGEKTIARPSGILSGGIVACIGSGIFLWMAKHYGYEYNFLFFALLFLGGYFLGVALELTIWLIVVKNRRK